MSNMQTSLPNNDFGDILIKFDMVSETGESPGLFLLEEIYLTLMN
jgi:hypothetical protein